MINANFRIEFTEHSQKFLINHGKNNKYIQPVGGIPNSVRLHFSQSSQRYMLLNTVEKLHSIVFQDQHKKLVIEPTIHNIIFKSSQGLPGVPGDGSNFVCGEDISYGEVVYLKDDGRIYKAGYSLFNVTVKFMPTFLMSQGDGIAGNVVFCKFRGKITLPDYTLVAEQVYYLGLEGEITLTPSTTGIILVVGTAISETEFFINFQPPILLR